jgi:hypothetical protein
MPRAVLAVAAVAAAQVLAGCGHNIGDNCTANVDCDPTGTRFCDVSAPNGYCTIEGCDFNTCPDEAVCIRFFTQVKDEPCTVGQPGCRADELCVCDMTVSGKCAGDAPNGHCAPQTSERRWCQLKCDNNGDCRTGYECRSTGTLGAEPVPTLSNPTPSAAKFCAPTATG